MLLTTVCLLAQAPAPANGAGDRGITSLLTFLPWILIGVFFYLILLRPERRKRAELDTMLKNLKKNDRVVTIGGILGTVVQAGQDSDEVTLRVDESNNTRIRVLRSSISRVLASESSGDVKTS
jgi:preprotein translocase subunit YajC